MFLTYYSLQEQPFGVTPDPRFLYQGEVHREALASLIYAVEAGLGFSSLIAEPGTGKTTLLYYLLQYYQKTASTAFLFDQLSDSRELHRNLLVEFEIDWRDADVAILSNRFREFLLDQRRARRRVLVILDEAQNLNDSVLEAVRLLSNFETPGAKLLHIILSGQPQLAEKLMKPQLLNVRQRISMATRLRPFAPLDVARYIAHRVKVAGFSGGELFTSDALAAVARLSGGVPREINRICFNALSIGCALQLRPVPAFVVEEAARDFEFASLLAAHAAEQREANTDSDLAAAFAAEVNRECLDESAGAALPIAAPTSSAPAAAPVYTAAAAVAASDAAAAACPVREPASEPIEALRVERDWSRQWRWLGAAAAAVIVFAALGAILISKLHSMPPAPPAAALPNPTIAQAPLAAAELAALRQTPAAQQADGEAHPPRGVRRAHPAPKADPLPAASETDHVISVVDDAGQARAIVEKADPPAVSDSDVRISGEVVMKADVDKYGHVENVEPLAGLPSLRQVAVDRVRQWVLEPRMVNGAPQPMHIRVRVWVSQ